MDLTAAWDELWGSHPLLRPLGFVMAGLGVLVIIVTTFTWLTDRSGYRRSFPYWGIIGGLMLAGPALVIPVMLSIVGGVARLLALIAYDPRTEPEPKADPTKTPEPASEPTTPPKPSPSTDFDPTIVFVGLGVAVGIVVLIAISYFVWRRISEDVRGRREEAKKLTERMNVIQKRWNAVIHDHRVIKERLLKAETDWDLLFRMPALVDPTVPATAALYRALHAANTADPTMPDSFDEESKLSSFEYVKCVRALASAWRIAEQNARKIGQSLIPEDERKKISQIRDLLAVAENTASGMVERQLAYRRIQRLVTDLNHVAVPQAALAELEHRKQLALAA